MKKLLTILFFFIIAFAQSQDYRTIDWKFIVSNVVLVNTDTFQINAIPTDFNDKGAISRTVGNYITDFVDRTFKVIDSTSTTLTVVDLASENIAPQTNQIARCYRSVLNASSLFSSIGGVDVSVLDELSRWKGVARNNELFARAIDTLDQIKLENPVETIIFDTSYSVTGDEVIGEIFWDEDNETYSAVLKDGVVGQLFEEVFITAQNNTGGTLADGKVATYEGTIGNSGNMRIELTVASADEPSFLTIGIITQDIEDSETGKVTTLGKVRGIQTDGANYGETWEDKDILYKSSTYAGGLTNVEPNAPIPAIPLAIVISAHATNGTLLVRPTFPVALTQLPDVNGTPVIASGQFPVWNNEEGYFDFDFNINDYSTILADSVTIATGAGSPTVNQLQLLIDNIGSSGFFLGGELSDGGAGTLDVAAGSGFIRTTNDENAELQSFKWSASAGIAVTDNTTQYVYVDDSGVISLSTDEFLETPDKIQIGVVTKESGDVAHTFSLGVRLQESIGNAGRFIRRVHGISRDKRRGGLIFGQSGDANRDVSITQGSLWWGRTEYLIPTFNTSGANTFITYSAGGLEDAAATAWPNLQYDNSGTLTNLGNNKWANLFFFIEPDSHIDMVYGRSQFNSEALADLEGVPSTSLPSIISQTSILAARFTFQKGSNTATISSAFEQLFANAGVTRHGDMSGLDYESAGHTGFVSDSNLIDSLNIIRDTTDALRIDINQNTNDIADNAGNILVDVDAENISAVVFEMENGNTIIESFGHPHLELALKTSFVDSTAAQRTDIDANLDSIIIFKPLINANTGKDTTGIYHVNRELIDNITASDTTRWGDSGSDNQTLSIDSTGRVFELSISGGNSVKFEDTNTQLSDSEVKTAYENNANTNAFTDSEQTNLGNQSNTNTGDQDLTGYIEWTDTVSIIATKYDIDTLDFLRSYTETDPVFTAHTVYNIANGTGFLKNNGSGTWTYDNSTYLTSFTELDPIYSASSWFGTTNNSSSWNTAYTHSQLITGNPHVVTATNVGLGNVENAAASGLYEPLFSKNTGFNKNFGSTTGTVLQGRTFGTAANNNTGDFEVPLTFSTGLTRSTNTITTNDSEINHDALLNYAVGQHRIINDAGTSATEMWSASKIDALETELNDSLAIHLDSIQSNAGKELVDVDGENQSAIVYTQENGTSFAKTLDHSHLEYSLGQDVYNKYPTGDIDGSNDTFTPPTSFITNSTRVMLNGIAQALGTHYTESGSTIVFESAYKPQPGDLLWMHYKHLR